MEKYKELIKKIILEDQGFNDCLESIYEVLYRFEPWNKTPLSITDIIHLKAYHMKIHKQKFESTQESRLPIGYVTYSKSLNAE